MGEALRRDDPAGRLAVDLEPVFAAHPQIAAVYLFGSVARDEAGPESDLDVGLVFVARGAPPAGYGDMAALLAYEIGKRTGHERVDVVALDLQGPIFCHRVLCEGVRIYEADRERRIDFESETMVRAFDFRPTWELATRTKPAALRRWLRRRYDLR